MISIKEENKYMTYLTINKQIIYSSEIIIKMSFSLNTTFL